MSEVQDVVYFDGRMVQLTWQPQLRLTSSLRVTQVSGACVTSAGKLLLVSEDGSSWTLPGGRPEAGESPEDTLRREVFEEACGLVTRCRYLGAQRVDDPSLDVPYFQLRFWARVDLQTFRPHHEMRHRTCVEISDARRLLWGGDSRIANRLLDLIERGSLPGQQ